MSKLPFKSDIIEPSDVFLGGYFDRLRNIQLDVYYSENAAAFFTINADGLQNDVRPVDSVVFNRNGMALYDHPEHWYASTRWAWDFAWDRAKELKIV